MDMSSDALHDVVVIGGGPAGLGAALILGRMAREVVVIDSGQPRNQSAERIYAFPTRDGIEPGEFYGTARSELARYPAVSVREGAASGIETVAGGFGVRAGAGGPVHGRRLLIATGISDEPPAVDGLREHWGRGIYTCAYCHGWELRGSDVAVLASTPYGTARMAVQLAGIGASVCVLAQNTDLSEVSSVLSDFSISVKSSAISRIRGIGERRLRVEFANGERLVTEGIFVATQKHPRVALAQDLGCAIADDGRIKVNTFGHTSVAGVFAAGDVARLRISASNVVSAAAEGVHVGMAIDQDLLEEAINRSGSDDTLRAR